IQVPSVAGIGRDVPKERIPELAKALGVAEARLAARLKRPGFVWLARQIDPARARAVEALDIPGVRQETEWRRFNPLGPATGHLLGFVGVDGHGLEGLEHSMNAQLSGQEGRKHVQRDARGHYLPGARWLSEPQMGGQVSLYLDATLQSMAYAALAEGVHEQNAKGGSVVVMRPADGAVLAMASWPGFNPNDYRRFQPRQWRNRAVTDVFEPGSTMKPFTMAAALSSGKWKPESIVFCEHGRYRVADYTIHDDHPQGWLNMTGVIAHSSNIGAAKLALDIGAGPLHDLLMQVGIGERTHTGLAGERGGHLLSMRRWGPVETANIAFGQGVSVTPLQMAAAFAVFANHGVYRAPEVLIEPKRMEEPPKQVMLPQVADDVMAMLRQATSHEGTGSRAVPLGYSVAGKTGTAQKPNRHGRYDRKRYTAVFAGITPADSPSLVILVMVDEPKKSIYGGSVAAPVFRHIAEQALPHLGIAPTYHALQRQSSRVRQVALGDAPSLAARASLAHLSLREVRVLAASHHWKLRSHGSGWVRRQQPASLAQIADGDMVEVWLDE
ncbi:MAG: penicillin-binding protein 2, partial [Mariprofundales bacterium]